MNNIDIARYTSRPFSGHREFWSAQQSRDQERVICFDLLASSELEINTGHQPFSAESLSVLSKLAGQDAMAQMAVCLTALVRVLLSHADGACVALNIPPLKSAPSGPDMQLPLFFPAFEQETVKEALIKVSQTLSSVYTYQDYPVSYFFPDILRAEIGVYRASLHARRPDCPVVVEFDEHGYALRVTSSKGVSDRMGRIMRHVDHVLATFAQTAQSIASLPILSPTEQAQACQLGDGGTSLPLDGQPQSIWQLFREQSHRHPEKLALVGHGAELTYRELRDQAIKIADALSRSGIRQGDHVALACDRSPGWIQSMLAIFSIGAIYVPISPDHPLNRIQAIIQDASIKLLVDPAGSMPRDLSDVRVMPLDELLSSIGNTQVVSPNLQMATVNRSDMAYVLYTSGSTGKPKGVQIRHGGFVNMVLDQIRQFGVSPADVVFQMAAGTFDASLSEIFMALGAGASLRLADPGVLQDMDRLVEEFSSGGVSVATLTPGHLTALEGKTLQSLKVLIVAGDVTHYSQIEKYLATTRVFNAYGPTETSVCATIHAVSREDANAPLPIGRAIANSHVFIVDRYLNPLPAGMVGQIVFSGTGVAAGYLGLESHAFLPEFGPVRQPSYLTGDLGSFRDDGTIDFFGRKDRQLKIRGYRIESAEVEQTIASFPYCRQVHVNRTQNQELAAWVAFYPAMELWPSIAEFYVYDDLVYGSMASDHQRNASYMAAFKRKLPGKTVLEIGPGPFAVLSRMAIEAGASRVYAVELSSSVATQAREEIKRHGLQDRITVIHGDIRDVTLPEKVDYCISEIVGSIGGSEGSAVLINESRKFLKDPENQIPAKSITKLYGVQIRPFESMLGFSPTAQQYTQAIFDQVGGPFDLRLCIKHLPSTSILTTDGVLEDLDYRHWINPETTHDTVLRVKEQGWMDGLIATLNLVTDVDHPEETIDILVSTGSWLPVYFPLGADALMVQAGDEIRIRVSRQLYHNQLNPDFHMDGRLIRSGREVGHFSCHTPHVSSKFREDGFYQQLFDQDGHSRTISKIDDMLRSFLKDQLPDYMLPERVIEVDAIPLNSSGKVDYRLLPQPSIQSQDHTKPRNAAELALASTIAQVLGMTDVGMYDDFFSLGGDSIRAIQVSARLAEQGWALSSTLILQHRVVADIAERMKQKTQPIRRESNRTGDYPLTPIQQWFMSQTGNRNHFNQSIMLERSGPIDEARLLSALLKLVNHHDGLRTRFTGQIGVVEDEYESIDLIKVHLEADQLAEYCDAVQASLDISQGVVFKAAFIRSGDASLLLLVAHHLVVDWVSWRVLVEDFVNLYESDPHRSDASLPQRTDSFVDWARTFRHHPLPLTVEEKNHWDQLISLPSLQWVDPDPGLASDVRFVSTSLSKEETASLVGEANKAYNTDVVDLLAAGLAMLSVSRDQSGALKIWMERHGRDFPLEDVNVSRTVGWFTSFFPVVLKSDIHRDIDFHVKATKDALRMVPSGGFNYLLLHPLAEPRVHVGLNYLGHLDQPSGKHATSGPTQGWTVSSRGTGRPLDPAFRRLACLDILANVSDGQLHVVLQFNSAKVSSEQAEQLLQDYLAALRGVIHHCSSRQVSIATVSDLTYQGLDEDALDSIFSDDKE